MMQDLTLDVLLTVNQFHLNITAQETTQISVFNKHVFLYALFLNQRLYILHNIARQDFT